MMSKQYYRANLRLLAGILICLLSSWCNPVLAKGGGGSGGGSISFSGVGYNRARNDNDQSHGSGFGLYELAFCVALGVVYSLSLKAGNSMWYGKIADADQSVERDHAGRVASRSVRPFTFRRAHFESSYSDSSYLDWEQNHTNGTIKLSVPILLPQMHEGREQQHDETAMEEPCRIIRGCGSDRDGPFKIVCGKISPSTGKCYWVEEPQHGGMSRQVLVTGSFKWKGPRQATFEGNWVARNWETGTFAKFDLRVMEMDDPGVPPMGSAENLPLGFHHRELHHRTVSAESG